ncbi:MAG: glycosyltransferase [Candidatus Zhuqueibacterota bacterium]
MDLSIIIVSYNVKEFLEQAIVSIVKSSQSIQYEIFVVDNASSDGSAELIRKKFPSIHLITNSDNKGFAAANNQALKLARGKYILLINPDTIVQEDTVRIIRNFIEAHPECGMVGCKILNPDGSLQLACRRSFPTPWVGFTKIIGLSKLFPQSRWFGRYNLTYLDPDETYEVEAISGSFMFFRRSVLEDVGYLDESFFMYGEDLDWCFRIQQAGWKIYYVPDTRIIHFKGESSKKSNIDLILQFYRAMKLFVEKHYHNRYFHVPQWLLVAGISLRASLTFLKRFLLWMLPGLIDGVLLSLGMMAAIFIRFYNFEHLRAYLPVMTVYTVIWLVCLWIAGSYSRKRYSSLRAVYGVAIGLLFNTSLTFFFNQYAFSRAVVLIAGALVMALLAGWRFALKIVSRFHVLPFQDAFRQSFLGRGALIVAPVASGQRIAAKLRERLEAGYDVYGIVTPEEIDDVDDENGNRVPVLGQLTHLEEIVRQSRVREIIFSTEKIAYDRILEIIARTKNRNLNFKLVPSSMDVVIGKASIEYIGDLPLMDIEYNLNRPINIFVKRSFDVCLSLISIGLLSPVFVYLLLVKRVKVIDCSSRFRLREFSGVNLTPFRSRLPYLWSILRGDVSFVGSDIAGVQESEEGGRFLQLKPGLFGLAQLNAARIGSDSERERYDLYYLKNYSLILDIEIIIKSVFKI